MTGQGGNSFHTLSEKMTVDCHLFASWAINHLSNLGNKTSGSLLVLPFLKSYILILSLVLLSDLIACICCLVMGRFVSFSDLDLDFNHIACLSSAYPDRTVQEYYPLMHHGENMLYLIVFNCSEEWTNEWLLWNGSFFS